MKRQVRGLSKLKALVAKLEDLVLSPGPTLWNRTDSCSLCPDLHTSSRISAHTYTRYALKK